MNTQPIVTLTRKARDRAIFRVQTVIVFLEDGSRDLFTTEELIWLLTQAVSDLDEGQINDAGAAVNTLREGPEWQQLAPFIEG